MKWRDDFDLFLLNIDQRKSHIIIKQHKGPRVTQKPQKYIRLKCKRALPEQIILYKHIILLLKLYLFIYLFLMLVLQRGALFCITSLSLQLIYGVHYDNFSYFFVPLEVCFNWPVQGKFHLALY